MAFGGAGFTCGVLIFVGMFFVSNNYSFYTNRPNPAIAADVKSNLHYIYLACKAYWAETQATNPCNVDIASLSAYGYIPSSNVVVWGGGGTTSDFRINGKSRLSNKVYQLGPGEIIRELENKELESAMAAMNK